MDIGNLHPKCTSRPIELEINNIAKRHHPTTRFVEELEMNEPHISRAQYCMIVYSKSSRLTMFLKCQPRHDDLLSINVFMCDHNANDLTHCFKQVLRTYKTHSTYIHVLSFSLAFESQVG